MKLIQNDYVRSQFNFYSQAPCLLRPQGSFPSFYSLNTGVGDGIVLPNFGMIRHKLGVLHIGVPAINAQPLS